MIARVQALGTAMPDHYVFKQSEIVEEFFARQPGWDPEWAEVFARSGVERRASVVDPSWYARPRSTADRMREFVPAARQLGAEAARRALEQAGPGAAAEVVDLLAVSCTGYSGPGLDVHLADDLGLGDRVQRLAVGHMGCYAALPALRTAAALATASGRRALVTCVELCTLHVQPARSREDAVYQALFGDGAAAALVGPGGDGPAIAGSATVTVPHSEERMGWLVGDDGFHMWLSPRVPALVERGVGRLVDDLLLPHGLTTATSTTGPSTRAARRSSTGSSGAWGSATPRSPAPARCWPTAATAPRQRSCSSSSSSWPPARSSRASGSSPSPSGPA